MTLLFYTYPVWVMLATMALDRQGAAACAVRRARPRVGGQRDGGARRWRRRHRDHGHRARPVHVAAPTPAYLIATDRHVQAHRSADRGGLARHRGGDGQRRVRRGLRCGRGARRRVVVATRRAWRCSPPVRSPRCWPGCNGSARCATRSSASWSRSRSRCLAAAFLQRAAHGAGGRRWHLDPGWCRHRAA